ncbi:MAG: hypothetical protein LQ338_007113 [Usnochroma carphineum]|nr:MAG: hypothetical protein LQ338_007113 [Usnochroma carphineum]
MPFNPNIPGWRSLSTAGSTSRMLLVLGLAGSSRAKPHPGNGQGPIESKDKEAAPKPTKMNEMQEAESGGKKKKQSSDLWPSSAEEMTWISEWLAYDSCGGKLIGIGHLDFGILLRHQYIIKMASWTPPPYFFPIVAGGIVGLILLIGFIGGMIKHMQSRKLEKDLEANQAMPESKAPRSASEMAQVEPRRGPDETRKDVEVDLEFVDVDLGDPVVRNATVYARVRQSLSRSSTRERSRARDRGMV